MNFCWMILLVVFQSTTKVFSSKSKHASTLAKLLRSHEDLFENVTFPENFQAGRGASSPNVNENIDLLQELLRNASIAKTLFSNYKKLYRTSVITIKEYEDEERHMKQFSKSLLGVLRHNSDTKKSYEKAINQFADTDYDELLRHFTGFKRAPTGRKINQGKSLDHIPPPPARFTKNKTKDEKEGRAVSSIPTAKDWRKLGIVSQVKNQGSCGSCTLFAAAGALESSSLLWHSGQMLDLSVQQLLDCIPPGDGHLGCDGNYMETTLEFMLWNGEGLSYLYPYKNEQGPCFLIPTVARVSNFYRIPNDEQLMKMYLALYGPIPAALHVNEDVQQYSTGIFSGECSGDINHSILLVGYGTENKMDYWIIKNSWGPTWGENGFFRILRNKNMCNISTYAFMITA